MKTLLSYYETIEYFSKIILFCRLSAKLRNYTKNVLIKNKMAVEIEILNYNFGNILI